jgi:hypothetical protein
LLGRAGDVSLALEEGGEDEMSGGVLRVELDGLVELALSGGLVGGIAGLEEAISGVVVGLIGIDGEGLLDLGEAATVERRACASALLLSMARTA